MNIFQQINLKRLGLHSGREFIMRSTLKMARLCSLSIFTRSWQLLHIYQQNLIRVKLKGPSTLILEDNTSHTNWITSLFCFTIVFYTLLSNSCDASLCFNLHISLIKDPICKLSKMKRRVHGWSLVRANKWIQSNYLMKKGEIGFRSKFYFVIFFCRCNL